MEKDLSSLEEKLGYTFKDKGLLHQALARKSFVEQNSGWQHGDSKALSYFGDALLHFLVVEELSKLKVPEHQLQFTDLNVRMRAAARAILLSNKTLASVADSFGFENYVLITEQEKATSHLGRDHILSSAFEAVTAAIYYDGGIDSARNFVIKAIRPHINVFIKFVLENRMNDHPKTALIKKVRQLYGLGLSPDYKVLSGTPGAYGFTVAVYIADMEYGVGEGSNKRRAETAAARAALDRLAKEGK